MIVRRRPHRERLCSRRSHRIRFPQLREEVRALTDIVSLLKDEFEQDHAGSRPLASNHSGVIRSSKIH